MSALVGPVQGLSAMIKGVQVKQLEAHCDERGRLVEILRSDDELFDKFGQVYFTTAYPGVIKAWHYHRRQTDHFAVIHGMARIALYDAREDSPTHGEVNEFVAGEHNPLLIRIPCMVYHGFKCVGVKETIVINIPTELYNYTKPDEHRVPHNDPSIPYSWERHDG